MKNGKVSLGLIGAGRAGMIHARNFRAAVPNAALTAVADPCKENVQAALQELEIEKGYEDYRELLKDEEIDAVIIVTPTKYHCEIAVEAARAGKHILCEKPMAMTVEECEIMEEAAARYHVKLQVAFMRRFDSAFMEARSVVDAGDIGDVVMVRSNTRGPSIPKPWMYDISKSNGPLAEVKAMILTPCAGLREVSSRRSMPWAAITAARTRERNSRISMTMSSCPQGLKTVCRV